MSEQTFIVGTEPQVATGPWTCEVEGAAAGRYLVMLPDNETGVYACDGDDYWLDVITCAPADPPLMIAPIYPLGLCREALADAAQVRQLERDRANDEAEKRKETTA